MLINLTWRSYRHKSTTSQWPNGFVSPFKGEKWNLRPLLAPQKVCLCRWVNGVYSHRCVCVADAGTGGQRWRRQLSDVRNGAHGIYLWKHTASYYEHHCKTWAYSTGPKHSEYKSWVFRLSHSPPSKINECVFRHACCLHYCLNKQIYLQGPAIRIFVCICIYAQTGFIFRDYKFNT